MWFEKKILTLKNVFFTLLILCCFSCSKTTLNSVFEKKYGKEVKKINVTRTPPKTSIDKKNKLDFALPSFDGSDSMSDGDEADYNQHYANVDSEEYVSVPPKEFFPNAENFEQAKSSPENLPKNMFDLTYHTAVSPPFKRSGIDFDLINIPKQDYYGVITAMTTKDYVLIGNDCLQKNVDQINNSRSEKDIEMSKILIKEQRKIRRDNKMIKVFGDVKK
ncbi:MAG: hypothetical protein KGQ36_03225 [Rickettsiales bacterium]|nr:hypothetical protein [Rickettsiales bacterium]